MLKRLVQKPYPRTDAVFCLCPKITQVCCAFPSQQFQSGSFCPYARISTVAASDVGYVILEGHHDVTEKVLFLILVF